MHCCKEYACTVLYIFETILSLSLGETLLYMKGVAGVPIYTSLVQPKA